MFTPPVIPNEHQSSSSRARHERKATQNTADGISQIDGLLVALNYLDHLPSHVRSQLFKDRSTNPSNFGLSSQTAQEDDRDISKNVGRESHKSSQAARPTVYFPTGIDRYFIEELRLAMIDQWRRLQTAVEVLNTPRGRDMATYYQNAEGFRNHGLLAFRETFLLKQAPTGLEKLFAMASISYAVSTILCSKEILLKSDILDGISAWIKRIASEDDRQVFQDIAHRMWQKCRSHFEIPPIEMSAPATDLTSNHLQPSFSFDYPFSNPAPGQSSPIATSSDMSFNTDYSGNGFTGPYTYSPIQNAHTFETPPPLSFGFNDLGSYGEAPAKPQCLSPYTPGLIGRESVDFSAIFQPWSPHLYGLSDANSQSLPSPVKAANESNQTKGHCQMPQCLRDSKSFCVLRAMFRYLDNSLHRLSGNGMTRKVQRDHPSSDREELVRRQIMEKLRRPWKTGQLTYDEPLQAVKMVTAQFLGWGILETMAQTQGFIMAIGKELVSDQSALASFCNWIASNSAGSQHRVLPGAAQGQSPARCAGASTSSVSKTGENNQNGFICDECGAWFRERKNLIRHAKTLPHPRKYKKRERQGGNEPSNKRQRNV